MLPSVSPVPAELKATSNGAWPLEGVAAAAAVGAWLTVLLIVTVVVALAPLSSVTVRLAVQVPAAYWCVGATEVSSPELSPKSQLRLTMVPSESLEVAELNDTVSGARPLVVDSVMTGVGATL